MRQLAWLLLASSMWGQTAPSAPMIRDAYSTRGDTLTRSVRLRGNLKLTVCKDEYDAWAQAQHPVPDLSLYVDGLLMKGTVAQKPATVKGAASDDQTSKIAPECAAASPASAAAEKVARDAEADAKTAADKTAQEKDVSKVESDKKDAADKAAAAKAAREKATAAAATASATYVLAFYLSSDVVVKADPKDNPWLQLLQRPWDSGPLAVSVGPATAPWPSEVAIPLERINNWWLAGWVALFIFAVVLFVKYARNSDIIRDTGTLTAGPSVNPPPRKAYSLARTQMALWTFLVGGALAFIFLVTWNENTITNGVLVLIGISSGTTLLAATADGTNPVPQATQGFFTDLLTDGTGPSFHRYQMVFFTVILAVIFVVKVCTNLGMPEFNTTLLGLMGISNGTYLGFKLQGR